MVDAVREVGLTHDDVHEAVKAVRLKLKEYLPGNEPDAEQVLVSEDLEDLSWRDHERLSFDIDAGEVLFLELGESELRLAVRAVVVHQRP